VTHKVFIKKAQDFYELSKDAFVKGMFDVSAFNAGQSVINANDALTMKFLGKRATKDHKDALKLNKSVILMINDNEGRKYLKELLDARRIYGYTSKNCSKKEAERLIRNANKFIIWVKKYCK
jgi:HEPN domain-containing protein